MMMMMMTMMIMMIIIIIVPHTWYLDLRKEWNGFTVTFNYFPPKISTPPQPFN